MRKPEIIASAVSALLCILALTVTLPTWAFVAVVTLQACYLIYLAAQLVGIRRRRQAK